MSPPNPPRSTMESIVDAAVKRATEGLRRDLEDAQREIRELQGVDQTVNETLAAASQRLTTHSRTQKALDVAIGSTDTRQSTFEGFVRSELSTVKAQVGSLVNRVPVTEGVIRQAVTSSDLAEQRSADVVVAQNGARLAIDGMRWKIIAGMVVAIILGVAQIVASTYVTLSRTDALEQHIDQRLPAATPK